MNVYICVYFLNYQRSYTFTSAIGTLRLYVDFKQLKSTDNLSDHLPIMLYLNCNIEYAVQIKQQFSPRPRWGFVQEAHIADYQVQLDVYLSNNPLHVLLNCIVYINTLFTRVSRPHKFRYHTHA